MINKIILSIIVVLSLGCKAQNNNISDQEIYNVINFVLNNGTVKYHKKLNIVTENPNLKPDEYFDNKRLKSFFSEKDSDYILEQWSSSKKFLLSSKYITNMRIIHIDEMLSFKKKDKGIWNFLSEKYGEEGFVFIGKPLFTLDKKQAVIIYGFYCGGLCGRGSRIILKKVNNNWIFDKEISGLVN